jgi:1-deoxy-D-xylulose-5-phosphate reductoisomerase
MEKLTLLGSTGSIGQSTLDVVRRRRDEYSVYSLVAGRNLDLLVAQILEFEPEIVVIANEADLPRLKALLNDSQVRRRPVLAAGPRATVDVSISSACDFVMSAIVGVAGMEATYEAVRCGKRVGLANKETLVAGGRLVMKAVREFGSQMIPVDSEHNGAHQCFRAGRREDVTRLILTASGGPFRNTPAEAFESITPDQALNHPTWKMGRRITIDSATLMNKGFEVIEACWLFDLPPARVDVVVHPQSTVHAMVEYNDGSVIAQVSATDMRMPIQYALTYPQRMDAPVPRLDWTEARKWEFHAPDFGKFPLLRLAYRAQEAGGSATCILNAADEIAVEEFLGGRLSFPGIAQVVEETLTRIPSRNVETIPELLEIDKESRAMARQIATERSAAFALRAAALQA